MGDVDASGLLPSKHWIKWEDDTGAENTLTASGVLMGKCTACDEVNIALTHQGFMQCTYCGAKVKWAWMRPKLAFLPQKASDYPPTE